MQPSRRGFSLSLTGSVELPPTTNPVRDTSLESPETAGSPSPLAVRF